jgi:hypothetical protein
MSATVSRLKADGPSLPAVLASTDWATIATFATAIGTLVLAVATFAAVRSANQTARIAEAAYRANLRPVLVMSRLEDQMQKIRWGDDHWAVLAGSQADVELVDGNVYLALSLRNVGAGLAVPIGWYVHTDVMRADTPHPRPDEFRMQTRDLFIAGDDVGFWQAAIRDHADPDYGALAARVRDTEQFTVDLLYGDHEGGQRTITRFQMVPLVRDEQTRWFPSTVRHWNLDRPDPR